MIAGIKDAFKANLPQVNWMDEETKNKALNKVQFSLQQRFMLIYKTRREKIVKYMGWSTRSAPSLLSLELFDKLPDQCMFLGNCPPAPPL